MSGGVDPTTAALSGQLVQQIQNGVALNMKVSGATVVANQLNMIANSQTSTSKEMRDAEDRAHRALA